MSCCPGHGNRIQWTHSREANLFGVTPQPDCRRTLLCFSSFCLFRHSPAPPLKRGGNRSANGALFRISLNRLRWDTATMAYNARRSAELKSMRRILRCLKRLSARGVYRQLEAGNLRPATMGMGR